jgi:hypothetical protein
MRFTFAMLVGVHGLIHLLGPTKAFGWASVPQLQAPISPAGGVLCLAAAVLLVGSAAGLAIGARWWWWLALPGVLLSQGLIIQAWPDAKVGTATNVLIAVPLLLLALDARPGSFRSRFENDRAALLRRPSPPAIPVSEAEVATLPPLYGQYLRRVGAVGRPHVHNLRVEFVAQMRSSPTAAWMPATARQYESFDPPARLFYMNATRLGVPMDVWHRYVDGAATFQVRVASLFSMVDQQGSVLTRAETVTIMNDIVVLAPAAVLTLPFTWETTGAHTLRATFTNAGHRVAATLTFDPAGDLTGFVSDDRWQASPPSVRNVPWSTPISGYREVDGIRVGTHGEANWIATTGEWSYGRFDIRALAYNVTH